jgi:hypothetical protein
MSSTPPPATRAFEVPAAPARARNPDARARNPDARARNPDANRNLLHEFNAADTVNPHHVTPDRVESAINQNGMKPCALQFSI